MMGKYHEWCDTCARRLYCPFAYHVRPPCPYYVRDPWRPIKPLKSFRVGDP